MSEEYQIVSMKIARHIKVCDIPQSYIETTPVGTMFLHVFIHLNSSANVSWRDLQRVGNTQLSLLNQSDLTVNEHWLMRNFNMNTEDVYVASEMMMMKHHMVLLQTKEDVVKHEALWNMVEKE